MPGMCVTAMTPFMALAAESSIDTTDAPCVAAIATTVGRYSLDEKRSVVYWNLPWTIFSMPYLRCDLPMILYSLAFFGIAALRGSLAASALISP